MRRFVPPHHHRSGRFVTQSPEVRFWQKVDTTTTPGGCWEWRGSRTAENYGVFVVGTKPLVRTPAHRFALASLSPAVPGKPIACHTCDNPPCCRPDHLFWGTVADNQKDAAFKGRMANGERNHWHKLTAQDVMRIRQLYPTIGYKRLAAQYGVTKNAIVCIIKRLTWQHLT